MAKKFLTPIDLNKNELQNAVIQNLATAPGTPARGQTYFDTVANTPMSWSGSAWLTANNVTHSGGDVTGGTTLTIANSAVTLAKMENRATQTFIGRNTAATGVPEELSIATAKTMLGLSLTDTANATGFQIAGGTTSKTLKVNNTITLAAADDTSTLTISAGGGTLNTGAFAAAYVHPVTDGNMNMPATSTTNNGKVLMASTTAGSAAWTALPTSTTAVAGITQLQDDLLSTSTTLALTANQGKALKTLIDNAATGLAAEIHPPVQSLALCKAITSSGVTDKCIMLIEDLGLYRWDATQICVSDDASVIRPTDVASDAAAGRWLRMSTILNDHNSLTGMQGGQSSQYYHLTSAQSTALTAISGLATIAPSAPAAAAVLGVSAYVAKQDHQHAFQPGMSHIHAYSTGTTDVSNSPYTALDGITGVALRASTNITLTMDASGVISIAAAGGGGVTKYSTTVGDGAALSYVITHSLNSFDVVTSVYLNSATYDEVQCDVQHTSLNTITLLFTTAPTSAQYKVVVLG